MASFDFRKVNAILRVDRLEAVEKALRDIRIRGLSVTRVKGYGEYVDLHARDWMTAYARIEIFTPESRAQQIVDTICAAASTGTPGDGIVSVLPVERVWHIRTRAPAGVDDL